MTSNGHPRRRVRPLASAVALLGTLACGSEEPPRGPIRLADALDSASITTPLRDIAAVRTLDEIEGVRREVILSEDFESFDPQAAHWSRSARAGLGRDGDNTAFAIRELKSGDGYGWIFTAEPNAHYTLRRKARIEGSVDAAPLPFDFAVVERTKIDRNVSRALSQRLVPGLKRCLKFHWPAQAIATRDWQEDSVSFFTTPLTHAITVIAMARRAGDEDLGIDRTWFDDIVLERVHPSHTQAMALLKSQRLAPGADAELGIDKYGQFPPIGDSQQKRSATDDNFSCRRTLYAPPPTDIAFPITLPADAVLRFSIALARETAQGRSATFSVVVRDGGDEDEVWSKSLTAAGPDWRWHEQAVELSRFAGRNVELLLRTRAPGADTHPVWGNPVVGAPYAGDGVRNVILIAVDTLRADRLSCYGYRQQTSPHLDALAADGVRFENVASNANGTSPSFASIFTGLVVPRHGVHGIGPESPLPTSHHTLAERFQEAGWITHSIAEKAPLYDAEFSQGFDVFFNVPRVWSTADENLEEALEWLDTHRDWRNFLFLHFNDPHQPFTQPDPFITRFGPPPSKVGWKMPFNFRNPPGAAKNPDVRTVIQGLYDGEVAYVDDRIGAFVKALRERGLYDNAVIAFVSDHGEQLFEHGGFGHGGTMLHDEVVRVPLIVKPPAGQGARNRVVHAQVRGFDVMPTLLEYAGLPVDDDMQAQSLVPLLTDGDTNDAPDRLAITESSRGAVALREPAWKYLLVYKGLTVREALFALDEDPGEHTNVAAEHPDVVERLRLAMLDHYLTDRPGHYLVVIVDGKQDLPSVDLAGAIDTRTLFGTRARLDDEGAVDWRGAPPAGALAAVVEVRLPRGAPADAGGAFVEYEPGLLQTLVAERQTGVYRFAGPPPVVRDEISSTVDARLINALRELGYAGTAETGGK